VAISKTHKRKAIRIGALLTAFLLIAACAEIKPYPLPNHREEGPAKGLFTGSQGGWVIVGPRTPQKAGEKNKNWAAKSETDREQKENPEKSADGEQ
jgi:hypothetical protein